MGKRAIALLVAGAFVLPLPALAAGLGKLTVFSGLGQPLRAEIEIVSLQKGEAETLNARLAPSEAFAQANIDFQPVLQQLRFAIERRAGNRYVINMTSVAPVNDPFVDALVELSWATGRLVREYTFLLDPVDYKGPQVDPQVTPPVAAAPAVPAAPAAPSAGTTLPGGGSPGLPGAAPVPPPIAAATPAPGPATAPAPIRPAPAARPAAGPASASGGEYEVKTGDYLAKIAQANMAGGVTLQQMLVALYRANEDAFIGKNMNRLRAGRILKIPTAAEAQAIAQGEAGTVVSAHTQEWNAYRTQLAAAAGQATPDSGQTARGQIGGRVVDRAPPTGDRVQIAQGPGATGAGARGQAAADAAAARERALAEAQSRVKSLEGTVSDLQKALALKNEELARMQQQAQAQAKPAAIEPPKPAVEPSKAPAAVQPPPVVEPPKPPAGVQPPPVVEPPKPPVVEPPKPVAVQPPPQPAKPPAPPAPVAEQSMMDSIMATVIDNALYIGGGLIALILGIFGLTKFRKKKSEQIEDSLIGPATTEAGASSVFGSTGGRSVDTGSALQTDFSQSGIGAIDTDEVDPVAEADVYMAYGRDAQAEEILKEALQKDPNRHAVRVKLLEIYAARKDLKAFETTAGELYAATGGQGPDWERAAALGVQVDPTNPMFGAKRGAAPAMAAAAAGAAVAAAAPAKPQVDFNLETTIRPAPVIAEPTRAAGPTSTAPGDLGFDLNLGDPSLRPAPSRPVDTGVLDFELPTQGPKTLAPNVVELDLATAGPASKSPVDLGGISLDLGAATAGPISITGGGDSRWQEVATKLDLAKAYHEMGDREGARELLNEVLKEGDGAQQQQAKKMLETIA